MVRSRQVTILAMAGSVAKSRLLRLACEAIERICEMGDVWSGPACTRPMRGTGPLSEALRGASILPSRVAPRTRRRICSWNRLFFRMRAQTVIQQRARVGLGTRSSMRRGAKNRLIPGLDRRPKSRKWGGAALSRAFNNKSCHDGQAECPPLFFL